MLGRGAPRGFADSTRIVRWNVWGAWLGQAWELAFEFENCDVVSGVGFYNAGGDNGVTNLDRHRIRLIEDMVIRDEIAVCGDEKAGTVAYPNHGFFADW